MQIKKRKAASIELPSAKSPASNLQPKATDIGANPSKSAADITALAQLKAAKNKQAPQPSAVAPAANAQEEAIVDSASREKYKARLKKRIK